MTAINMAGLTMAMTSSLLTATGAETVHDSTALLTYCINGKFYAKSGTNADQATPTTDGATGLAFKSMTANEGCIVVWGYNSAGTVKCIQGNITEMADGAFLQAPEFPANIPDSICPFAYQVLKCASTAGTVIFGTSNWNATGFTNAIVNVAALPNRPKIS